MGSAMKALYVCTANICRSPLAAGLLRQAAVPGVQVASAGTRAVVGMPGCSVPSHRSVPLSPEALAWADLVLTAAREHQAAVVELDPGARQRTFTIKQAGRLSDWLRSAGMVAAARAPGQYPEGDPRRFVAPLPTVGRTDWLVAELDAARGMAPVPVEPVAVGRRRRRTETPHVDDIPDPHVLGDEWHPVAREQIVAATGQLVALLGELTR